jgi:alginate O-acetyltransferase complex protein AlgJ
MKGFEFSTEQPTSLSRFGFLAGLLFSGVMLAGAWQVIAVITREAGAIEFPRSWIDFAEGRSTGTIEKQFDNKLPARPLLITVANTVRYMIMGSGGDQVRTGKDGWLFLAEELRFEPDASANLKAKAELLGATARALEGQGVKLVVSLVPDKARLYADKLTSGRYLRHNQTRYQDALIAFQNQGVTAVDLLQPLVKAAGQTQVYYRTDTHWNQVGAQVAAQAVAAVVLGLRLDLEKTSFSNNFGGAPTERPGDLIRLMGLDGAPKCLGPLPDLEAPVVTQQISADKDRGLFDEYAVPVVLTGTSYSLRANFVGFLQQSLSAKVLNAAQDGSGFLQATKLYLENEAFQSAKPKVLIWELPERFLYGKLDNINKVSGAARSTSCCSK